MVIAVFGEKADGGDSDKVDCEEWPKGDRLLGYTHIYSFY